MFNFSTFRVFQAGVLKLLRLFGSEGIVRLSLELQQFLQKLAVRLLRLS